MSKITGKRTKDIPDSARKSGISRLIHSPNLLGLCVASVCCDTLRYSADGDTTPQNSLSGYSHSFTLVCRRTIPVGSSSVVGFNRLAAESLRVSLRRRLGQILGQIRELFRNREPVVSFLSRGQKREGFEAQNRPKWIQERPTFLFGASLAK